MYIDPIHSGTVALAHAVALATRAQIRPDVSAGQRPRDAVPSRGRHKLLRRLTRGWDPQKVGESPTPDAAQLMLWSECAGRAYTTSLGGLLLVNYIRKNFAAGR